MKDRARKSPHEIPAAGHRFFASIRARLFLLLLSVLVPVMLLQTGYIYIRYKGRVKNEFRVDREMSRVVAGTLHEFFANILREEMSIGANFTVHAPPSTGDMDRILELDKEEFPAVHSFTWLSPHGRVIACSHDPAVHLNLSDRDYVRKLISGRQWVVSDLIISRADGQPIFTVSHAIRTKKGNLLGIVVAAINPAKLGNVLSFDQAKHHAITVIDDHGMAVYRHPEVKWNWEKRNLLKSSPAIGQALKGREFTGILSSFDKKERRVVSFNPVSSIGWVTRVSSPEAAVMAPLRSQFLQELSILLFIMAGVFLGAFLLSEGISGSIRRLLDHAVALGSGDLKEPIEESGPAELKGLASAFNVMAEKVGGREEALKAARERLFSVFEAIPAVVYLQTPDCGIRFANRTFRENFGDPQGKHCYELFRGGSERCENCGALCTIDTQAPRQWEWTDSDGRCYSIYSHPFTDSDGSPLALKLAVDISERKRAWQAFLESEKRYGELVQNANSAIIHYGNDGAVTLFNEYAQAFFGYSKEEMIGKHVGILLPEKQSDGTDSTTLIRDALSNPERYAEHVNENIRRDGSLAWMAWTNRPILDEGGKVAGMLSVGTDITKLKQAEETLRKSEERFRELAENIDDVFWVITPEDLLYVSPAYEQIWGRSCESLYENPNSFMELVHPEDRRRVRLAIKDSFKGKGPSSEEFRIVRRDGTIRWIFARSFPVLEQGRLVRTVGIAEDVTTVKQAGEFLRIEKDLAFGLGETGSLAEGMKYLLEACFKFDGLDSGAIYLVENGVLKIICQQGLSDGFLQGTLFNEQVFSLADLAGKGQGRWSKPLGIPEMGDLVDKEGVLAFWAVPVLHQGEVVSLLCLASHVEHEIPENVRAAVEVFATRIGGFISRVRLVDTIKAQSEGLKEVNAALKVLLRQREEDRSELEESLLRNVEHLIAPCVEKLKKSRLADDQKNLVAILESHLMEITSPFAHKISAPLLGLTPMEIRVADLIRKGKGSKEIADLLAISEYAVIFHRQGIRRKLGLTGTKLNLQTHLGSLE